MRYMRPQMDGQSAGQMRLRVLIGYVNCIKEAKEGRHIGILALTAKKSSKKLKKGVDKARGMC